VIRAFRRADAAAVLALVREVLPLRVETVESVLHGTARARCWVAEEAAAVVGYGQLRGRKLWLGVAPAARRRGLGGELWARLEEHAEEPAGCWTDSEAGIAFAQARGFRPTKRVLVSTLDLRTGQLTVPEPPPGVQLVPWAALGEVPPELDAEEHAAVPHLLPDVSVAAVVEGRPVAYSLLAGDERGLAENQYTFTLPGCRGRGLALLCKRATLARAQAAGLRLVVTANLDTNAPMLAVNRRLGYRPRHVRTTLERT
jgi:GNAT superfamily N-acetyltransferase